MPISYPFKTIFIHIPKSAGTSIEKYLGMGSIDQLFSYKAIKNTALAYDRTKFSIQELTEFENVSPQHLTMQQLQKIIKKDIIQNFYKFAIVRNPYNRLLSEYSYITEIATNKLLPYVSLPFPNFVEKVLSLPRLKQIEIFDGHLLPQVEFVTDNEKNILVDRIFRFEELEECFSVLQNIPKASSFIPHSRQTSSSQNQDLLTTEIKEIIHNFYKEDFLFFNYEK